LALRRRRGRSLATRVTVFTLVALVLAVLLIGAVSLVGVYELARTEDESRLTTYRQLLTDGVNQRLSLVEQAAEFIAWTIGPPVRSPEWSTILDRGLVTNARYFDAIVMADGSGRVISSVPATGVPSDLADSGLLNRLPERGRAVFAYQRGADGSGRLWLLRSVSSSDSRTLLLGARVQPALIDAVLDEAATDVAARAALIVDEDGGIVSSALHSLRVDARFLELTPASSGPGGEAYVTSGTEGPLAGFYDRVSTAPELGWSVVVLEPTQRTLLRARSALLPAGSAALVVCLVAVLSVLVYGRRVAAPLAAFERRARDMASGGYVRPMLLERSDELGRLADAFNAMAVRLNSLQDMAQLLATARASTTFSTPCCRPPGISSEPRTPRSCSRTRLAATSCSCEAEGCASRNSSSPSP
jgi:HAMP domain-containing protein